MGVNVNVNVYRGLSHDGSAFAGQYTDQESAKLFNSTKAAPFGSFVSLFLRILMRRGTSLSVEKILLMSLLSKFGEKPRFPARTMSLDE